MKNDSDKPSVSSAKTGPRTLTMRVPNVPRPHFRRPSSLTGRRSVLVAFLLLVSLGAGYVGSWLQHRHDPGSGLITSTLSGEKKITTSQSQLISQIAKDVGPSVVSVNVNITSASSGYYSRFGFVQPESEAAAGTGIVISDNIIMTNRHVVPEGTTDVSITLSDGTELDNVSVIGRTSDNDSLDVAFLKVNDLEGHTLKPATIGDSTTVLVGDDVVAIGNALGQFQNTVTSGIISGYGRSVIAGDSDSGNPFATSTDNLETLDNLFQTDAAINEGNSGGPLVNLNGQVIGINTAVAGDAQNIGFAIPINEVRGLIDQILKTGSFKRPYLGIRYLPLTADVAQEYKLDVEQGAFIPPAASDSQPSVLADGPAKEAGVQDGDVITKIDGTAIDQTHSLTSLLDDYQPGDTITLTIARDGKTLTLDVTLGSVPQS